MTDLMPTDASIITTYRCCMKCKMCSIWKYPSDILKEIKAKELEILPQLKIINITGGEPLVRNDLEDIIEVAFKKSPRVVISTAGYHVDEILALADKFPNIGIRVSLEGLSTINDHLRGRDGGFDRGIRTLQGLRQMGIKDIGVATTISDKNCHELMPIYQLTQNMGMEFATATFHNSYYFHKQDNNFLDKDTVAESFFELADHLLKDSNPKNWFRAFFNLGLINYIYGNKRVLPCEAGTVNFFIEPYGDVYPCNGLEERYWKETMGNIRDFETFEGLWHGEKAKNVRELVKTCPKNCWMVGTAAPVMKKYIRHPVTWVMKNKIKSLLSGKLDHSSIPKQYDVGQSPLQGDLRGGRQFAEETVEEYPICNDKRFMTRVIENKKLTSDTFLLKLERGDFQFTPGQNVSIGPYMHYFENRDYTVYSSIDDDCLEFLIKKVKIGRISSYLYDLKPGDKVEIVGPYGDFFVSDIPGKKHLFVATGVGIGPFHSFTTSYPNIDYTLIHGIRKKEDLILSKDIDPDRYISCISQEDGGDFKGRVTDFLANYKISNDAFCYICGNPYMLKQVNNALIDKGIYESNIFIEAYYAY